VEPRLGKQKRKLQYCTSSIDASARKGWGKEVHSNEREMSENGKDLERGRRRRPSARALCVAKPGSK